MSSPSIAVIGLDCVGLPLALALAGYYPVIGFDTSATRVAKFKGGHDHTGEIPPSALRDLT